jgi:hypothetical protein
MRSRDEDRIRRTALAALRDWSARSGRRVLLIVENLDMLFDQTLDEPSEWALRQVLQSEPWLMLLATAVRRFEGLDAHDRAFYEAFRRFDLPPLTPAEVADVWHAATGLRPPHPRCQAIRVLTGGNPRMVRLLASLSMGSSLRAILDELTTLVDRHTDYFKGNIEALSGHKRRIFLALATLWRPATAAQVAAAARLDTNLVSAELHRLALDGRVEVVPRPGRTKHYQVSERLYNIYYLMRRSGGDDARVRALVDFIAVFYEPDELGLLVGRVRDEHRAEPDAQAACAELIRALYHRRRDPEAREAIAGAMDAELLTKAPYVRRSMRKEPAEVLALINGAAGDAALEDARVCLAQFLGDLDPVLADLAEAVLRRPNLDDAATLAVIAAFHLVRLDDRRARQLVQQDIASIARVALLTAAAFETLTRGDWHAARTWSDTMASVELTPEAPPNTRRAFDFVLDPAAGAVLVEVLRLWPSVADLTLDLTRRVTGRLDTVVTALRAASDPTPVHRAALARALCVTGRPAEAADVAAALAAERPSPTSHHDAALHAVIAERPEQARQHIQSALTHNATPGILALAAVLNTDAAAVAALREKAAVALGSKAGLAETWAFARVAPVADLSAAWDSLLRDQRTHISSAMLDGAQFSEQPDVWRWALERIPEDPNPNDRVVVARLWGRCGRPDHALAQVVALLTRSDAVSKGYSALLDLGLRLAAAGLGDATRDAFAASPYADAFAPLLVALGDTERAANASPEELQVAADVRQRLDEVRGTADIWRPQERLTPPPLSSFHTPSQRPRGKRARAKERGRGA